MGVFKYIGFVRGLCTSLLFFAMLVAIAYSYSCTRVADLRRLNDNEPVIVVGWVQGVCEGGQHQAVYRLADFTGSTFVGTGINLPQPRSLIVIRAIKRSTDSGRPMILEEGRTATLQLPGQP